MTGAENVGLPLGSEHKANQGHGVTCHSRQHNDPNDDLFCAFLVELIVGDDVRHPQGFMSAWLKRWT